MPAKILIIEDEMDIQNFLKDVLEDAGYLVSVADDCMEGFMKFQNQHFDLVLLDILLPKIDGYVVLEMIRKESDIPVIMLTAMGSEKNQIKGFDLKADDYIVKPFSMNIVLKRIEAVLRRATKAINEEPHGILKYKELTLDLKSYEARMSGNLVALTRTEFELLRKLLENKNCVLTRDQLLNDIWGYEFFGNDRVVNVHIGNIRKKLGADYIETIRGVGYKIASED